MIKKISGGIYIVFILILVAIISYFGGFIQKYFDSNRDENALIQKYLLNESPLYGRNKPKLWIHTKHDINARNWKTGGGRNTIELNQPYIHMTLKTMVDHCSADFNVCLIDDTAFSKLLPNWEFGNVTDLPEPEKSRVRLAGLLGLVHIYGGLVIPNTFVCLKSLFPMFESLTGAFTFTDRYGLPVLCCFGCAAKNDGTIQRVEEMVLESLRRQTSDYEFLSDSTTLTDLGLSVVDGCFVGLRTKDKTPVLVDDLLGETPIQFTPDLLGILIDEDELLSRTYYNWFTEIPRDDILVSNAIVARYLTRSLSLGEVATTVPNHHITVSTI